MDYFMKEMIKQSQKVFNIVKYCRKHAELYEFTFVQMIWIQIFLLNGFGGC